MLAVDFRIRQLTEFLEGIDFSSLLKNPWIIGSLVITITVITIIILDITRR
jgi:hypothetical protein